MPHKDPAARRAYMKEWLKKNPRSRKATEERWKIKNREWVNEYHRNWNKANPGKVFAKKIKNRYGLTVEAYTAILESQGGVCPIGGHQLRYPSVDHDHETGEVRGILCRVCNSGLGMFRTPENLRAAADYLEAANASRRKTA